MKISMWMLAQKLEKYHPKCSIIDGTACITGIRFLSSEKDTVFQPQYVYLSTNEDSLRSYSIEESLMLCNGPDRIFLPGRYKNEIFNEILTTFEFYNAWEKELREASACKSFQQIIDLGDSVLGNPMLISDMDGNVLAMSSSFIQEDINEYWIESRESGCVPAGILGAPMHTPDGRLSSWTDTLDIYILPDGTKIVGAYLKADAELIAAFGLWEYKKPILPSDIQLMQVLYEVLIAAFEPWQKSVPMRSCTAIFEDLLSGTQVHDDLIRNLEQKVARPWQLLVIDNPFHNDVIYQRNLIQRLQTQKYSCIPLLHEDYVTVLLSEKDTQAILTSVLGYEKQQYYLVCTSLPFDNLQNIPVRYSQTVFAVKSACGKPGIYQAENYMFPYLHSLFARQYNKQDLIHPALNRLKRYDAEKNTELYETLYQYLINERSIVQSAQIMHIHKNSLMYRIQKIQSIIRADLDDPMTRTYLLLSCLIDRL